jgi:ribosomal protein S18 acetylase RimI-like enzyme
MTIRPYRIPDDVEGLARVYVDSATHHRAIDDLPPLIPAITMDYARQRFANLEPDDKRLLLVAEVDSEVVGLVEATMRRDDAAQFVGAYVDELAVATSWRGHGVGTRLMAEVESWAARNGALSLALDHLHTNEGAHRLYERLGYQSRGVIMEKRLRA